MPKPLPASKPSPKSLAAALIAEGMATKKDPELPPEAVEMLRELMAHNASTLSPNQRVGVDRARAAIKKHFRIDMSADTFNRLVRKYFGKGWAAR